MPDFISESHLCANAKGISLYIMYSKTKCMLSENLEYLISLIKNNDSVDFFLVLHPSLFPPKETCSISTSMH